MLDTDPGDEKWPEAMALQNDYIRWLVQSIPQQSEVAYTEETKMQHITQDDQMAQEQPHCVPAWGPLPIHHHLEVF